MKQGLGKGLSSLIPRNPRVINSNKQGDKDFVNKKSKNDIIVETLSDDDRDKIIYVSPKKIMANVLQPRKSFSKVALEELSESIKQYGIIQPLVVRREGDEYELIAGERRLRASKIAELKEVPVIVREYDQQTKLEVSLVENIQRENLNAMDKAMAYRKLIDEFNISAQEIADKIGKNSSTIFNSLRIIKLPEEIRNAVRDGILPERQAQVIAGLESEARQMNIFRKVVDGGLSYVKTRKLVFETGGTKHARVKINYADQDREKRLSDVLGLKSSIRRTRNGGHLTINFSSDEELKKIMDKINQ